MFLFILRRLAAGLVLVFVIGTLTFFLTSLTGSDPARQILGNQATLEQIAAKRAELGLDQPLLTQYGRWLGGVVQGDLGTSWSNNQSVSKLVSQALPITMSLVIGALVLTAILGVGVGVLAAVRGGWIDKVVQVVSVVAFAVPNFLLGLVLALVFAVGVGHLSPPSGTPPSRPAPAAGWPRSPCRPSPWRSAPWQPLPRRPADPWSTSCNRTMSEPFGAEASRPAACCSNMHCETPLPLP